MMRRIPSATGLEMKSGQRANCVEQQLPGLLAHGRALLCAAGVLSRLPGELAMPCLGS